MNNENNQKIKFDKNDEFLDNEIIVQESRQIGSISLPYTKMKKNISSNSLDFDIISEEEINDYSKSLYVKKKNYKTDIKNLHNNYSQTENIFENHKHLNLNQYKQNKVKYSNDNFFYEDNNHINTNEVFTNDEIESKINILKESILIDLKSKNDEGMWSNLTSKFSHFKNYLKYNFISTNKQLKLTDLNYVNLFDQSFSCNQFTTNEFNFALNKIFSFTYRSDFTNLFPKDNIIYNSDCGWGCMIRAGQMMLSKAILEFKIYNQGKETNLSNEDVLEIKINVLKLFFDNMINFEEKGLLDKTDFLYFFENFTKILNEEERKYANNLGKMNFSNDKIFSEKEFQNQYSENNLTIKGLFAPFSIQNITKLGILYDAGPGVWFSDAKVIKIFKEIEEQLNIFNGEINIFSFDAGVIYEKDIIEECFEEVKFQCFNNCKNSIIGNKINKNDKGRSLYDIDMINSSKITKDNFEQIKIEQSDFDKNNLNENNIEGKIFCEQQMNKNRFKSENICFDCLNELKSNNIEAFQSQFLEIDFPIESEVKEGKYSSNENNNQNKNLEESINIIKRFYRLKKTGFIFISVRHGINSIEKEYHYSIKQFYKIPCNLGIIGGKANSAFYFIGEYQDKLIYLDPHLTQKALENLTNLNQTGYDTYNPKYLYYLDIKNISPGFTMGFYFRDVSEYKNLKNSLNLHSELKHNLFTFEKVGEIKKFKKKMSMKKTEEMKFTEVIEDDFNIIDIEDDF